MVGLREESLKDEGEIWREILRKRLRENLREEKPCPCRDLLYFTYILISFQCNWNELLVKFFGKQKIVPLNDIAVANHIFNVVPIN